jgi:hypothetical protein
LFDKCTDELKRKYSDKFQKIVNKEKGDIKNQTNQLFENQKIKIENLFEEKTKEIENKSICIVEESSKKVKDVSKRIDILERKLDTNNLDKKKIESIVQDAKRYTDTKMESVLNEAKRFTRIMMDMVGGGGGSVAVQYAAGGTINGDLNVNGTLSTNNVSFSGASIDGDLNIGGDLNVGGTSNSTTILSGGVDLTKIFAGEGEGDDNPLDGGII